MNKLLNLGCGSRFNSSWINVDFSSSGEGVIAYDLTRGIPFPDASFDVVYHSHLLEHFPRELAEEFICECHRVLKLNGVLRIAVPDLEIIARTYLKALEFALAGSEEWIANYEWIMLEMYDQTVRNYPGGAMMEYLSKENITNKKFILDRCGVETAKLIETAHYQRKSYKPVFKSQPRPWLKAIYRFFRALKIGRFRQDGEIHQWMYDRYSLSRLLEKTGFKEIVKRTADESYVINWVAFNLDTEPDGSVYKPDSLYMEAVKS